MSIRNRNPSEPRRSDQPIKRITSQFNGMISGEPQTKIPANYCKKNVNVIDRGGYCDIRGGSNKYSTKNFLYGFEPGAAYYEKFWKFTSDVNWNIGDAIYFVGDDLPGYKINGVSIGRFQEGVPYYLSFENILNIGVGEERYFLLYPTYAEAVHTTTGVTALNAAMAPDAAIPGSNSTICFVHNYMYDHVKANKIIFVEGSNVYVANKALTTFTKVLKLGAGYRLNSSYQVELLSEVSSIIAFGDNAIIASKVGGFWKIILTDTFYYMYQINSPVPTKLIPDINYSISLTFGYLYLHTFCRITGTGNRDRTSDGALLQFETGTVKETGVEKDYGEVYFATEVGKDLTNYHVVGGGISTTATAHIYGIPPRGATHIGLYRTKDIGPAGSAPSATAIGNRRDYLVWVADIPICKALKIDTRTSGHAKIVSGNKFVLGDIGSIISIYGGDFTSAGQAEITGWVNEDDVTITALPGISIPSDINSFGFIGGGEVAKGTQSVINGENVIESNNSYFSFPPFNGSVLFISDGTIRHTVRSISATKVVVAESGNFTDLAITRIASNGSISRAWNDTLPDAPQADGRVSWDDRKEFGTDLYIPRRFFVPLPNCDIMHISNGFLICGLRDTAQYYYCQTGDKEYTIGHYKYPEQSRKTTGSIQHIIGMGDRAIVLMKDKTGIVTLSSSQNIGRTEIGENIYQLPEISVVDDNRGVIAWKLITFKNSNILFALCSDGAFRYFDGSMWSQSDYGFINGLDAVSKDYLKRIDHSAAYGANYNSNGGIKLWAKRIVDGVSENICLRFSTDANEGQGWSIIEGDHWVEPMESFGVFTILDDNGIQRCLVIDKNDHYIYEIDTFDRITRERKYVLDKTGVQNAEITWSKTSREEIVDVGSQHKRLKHQQSYVNVMPEYVEDRGKTGYTATGIRNAQELTLKAFEDGEQITAAAQTDDFPEDGELVFSGRKVEASRIATELSGTAGEIRITGIVNEFLAENKGPGADKRIMTESSLEEELNQDLIYHACRANIDRISGDSLGAGVTFITGPDGRSKSGMIFVGTRLISITGTTHTIILWSKDSNLFLGDFPFIQYGTTIGGWNFNYYKGIIATPTITLLAGSKADIRIYDKAISDDAIFDLYADTVNFEGKRHLPGFRITEDL